MGKHAAVFEALAITRQTLHNWYTQAATKDVLQKYRCKQGNKNWYDIEGVLQLITQQPYVFGNGREYPYKDAIQKVAQHTGKSRKNTALQSLSWWRGGQPCRIFQLALLGSVQ